MLCILVLIRQYSRFFINCVINLIFLDDDGGLNVVEVLVSV
jgi:hypothetical protein